MDEVKNELAKLGRALLDPALSDRRDELYAAQQALAWVTEPTLALSPLAHLTTHYIAAADKGYSAHSRPPPLSGTAS